MEIVPGRCGGGGIFVLGLCFAPLGLEVPLRNNISHPVQESLQSFQQDKNYDLPLQDHVH